MSTSISMSQYTIMCVGMGAFERGIPEGRNRRKGAGRSDDVWVDQRMLGGGIPGIRRQRRFGCRRGWRYA
jgi:hypothetical protein